MNWERWLWRWRLFKRRLAQKGEELAPRARSSTASLKTCRECRALIARTARTCPECGARLGWFAPRTRAGGGIFEAAPATAALLVAIVGLFLATWVASGLGPGGPSGRVLVRFGANNSAVFGTAEYWRLLTGVFLHGGFLHILFNSAALNYVGREVESVYGWGRTLVLFIGAGVVGSAVSTIYHPFMRVGVGASGAIFGLIGVVGVFGYRRGGAYGRGILRFAAQWAAFGLVYGLIVNADNAAHVGGLAGGVVLAFLVPPEREEISPFWNAAGIVAASLVPLAFVFAIRAAL